MSNYAHFRSRLSSIMEILAEAAVAEINELMEDGYAVLRLEISQKQKENDALRKKLHMMEMRMARCFSQNTGTWDGSVDTYSNATQVCGELTSSGTLGGRNSSTVPSLCAKQPSFALWSDGESMSVNEDHSVRGEESADIDEGFESVHVKEETPEDLQRDNSQSGPIISDGKLVESSGGESIPSVEVLSEPVVDAEEPAERRSTRHSVWEDGRLDTTMNAEPDTEPVKLQASAERLYRLGNESVIYARPGEMEMFFTQKSIESENGELACSYSTSTDSESLSHHAQLQLGQTTAKDAVSSLGSCDGMDSAAFEMEAGACSSWDKETQFGPVCAQYQHKRDWETEKLHPRNVPNLFHTHARMVPRDIIEGLKTKGTAISSRGPSDETCSISAGMKTHNKTGTGMRRFICNFCGKGFSSPQNLQTHLRVHTGERPFSCAQCGKRFTQSGHLKTHQSVHTGERPYVCGHCGKKFAGKQNLRIHQQRNHQAD